MTTTDTTTTTTPATPYAIEYESKDGAVSYHYVQTEAEALRLARALFAMEDPEVYYIAASATIYEWDAEGDGYRKSEMLTSNIPDDREIYANYEAPVYCY
jgi:hypothetical protein